MAGIFYTPPPTTPTPPTPPGGALKSVQYNAGANFGGMSKVESDAADEHLQFIADNTVNAPLQGKAILYANSDDGDECLTHLNSWGKNFPLQLNIGHKIIGMAWPAGGASVGNAFAWSNFTTSVGTWSSGVALAAKSYSAGFVLPNLSKMNGATAAAINSSAEVYVNTINRSAIIGSASQAWGTKLVVTFGLPTYKNDQRIFAGYANAAGALGANVDPSTYTNAIGIIKDSVSGSFVFFVRGAGVGTSVNTGITPTLNGAYRATIFIPSSGSIVYLTFEEILPNTINKVAYSNNTTLPAIGTAMFAHLLANTGGTTATAVNLSLIQIYEEQL